MNDVTTTEEPRISPAAQRGAVRLATRFLVAADIILCAGLLISLWQLRADRPEIFAYGQRYLDLSRGVLACTILVATSIGAAWAVRAARAAQRRALLASLTLVTLGATLFAGLTLVEYSKRAGADTLWGGRFDPCASPDGTALPCASALAARPASVAGATITAAEQKATTLASLPPEQVPPRHAGLFFAHYFTTTALLLFHIILGIALLAALISRARRDQLGPALGATVANVVLFWQVTIALCLYAFWLFYLSA